jgi:hypothetical protein
MILRLTIERSKLSAFTIRNRLEREPERQKITATTGT